MHINKEQILILLVIVFGAIVHATTQFKISRDNKTNFNWLDFVILFVIACFAGLIFGLIATLFFSNIIWIILAAATGSFLGLIGLNRMTTILLEIISNSLSHSLGSKQQKDDK